MTENEAITFYNDFIKRAEKDKIIKNIKNYQYYNTALKYENTNYTCNINLFCSCINEIDNILFDAIHKSIFENKVIIWQDDRLYYAYIRDIEKKDFIIKNIILYTTYTEFDVNGRKKEAPCDIIIFCDIVKSGE